MTDYIKTVKAYEGTEPYIFISYAHKDSNEVLPLISALQENGYNVWFDNGIQAGSEWPIYIEQRLTDCTTVLVFMSEAAVASRNCRNEINLALKLNKELLVVHLEETVLRYGMELQLGSVQALFKYKQPDNAEFIKNLINAEALRSLRQGNDSSKATPNKKFDSMNAPLYSDLAPTPTQSAEDKKGTAPKSSESKIEPEKTKRTEIIKYVMLALSFLAFALGSALMYFISPLYIGADAPMGLIITLVLIGSVVILLSIPIAIIKNKSLKYSLGERKKVYDDVTNPVVAFGFLAIFVDAFLVGSTENVFFKILISIGINIGRYFIAMMFTPDEPK